MAKKRSSLQMNMEDSELTGQKSVNPDQMLQNSASNWSLHCLPLFQLFLDINR